MIQTLSIEGYRCFRRFEVGGVAGVNLLVGKNNSGKTALLEAIESVASVEAEPWRCWSSMSSRGELFPQEDVQLRRPGREYELCHLFTGHEIQIGSTFQIRAAYKDVNAWVRCTIVKGASEGEPLYAKDGLSENEAAPSPLGLRVESHVPSQQITLPLTRRGGLEAARSEPLPLRRPNPERQACVFVTAEAISSREVARYWQDIALNPEEGLVVDALRLLEPSIERVAYVGGERRYRLRERGGVVVKCREFEQRIPIGSMGDGMWHVLGIALALARAAGGVLLIDEIDTGLHYTVMSKVWEMILKTAKHLDVQVFATTHSHDCVSSLAEVCRSIPPGQVSLQRIELDKERAVAFTEKEILIAAERDMEVR